MVIIVYMMIIYLFINGKEIYKFEAEKKRFNFATRFCLGSISKEFEISRQKKYHLKEIF